MPGAAALRFNLIITDPLPKRMPQESAWEGADGRWVVTVSERCGAQRGHDPTLPLLTASVGGFSRFWVGAATAAALSLDNSFVGDAALLSELDSRWRLPQPCVDWDM